MATPGDARYVALVGTVALLTAGLLFLAWIFKLGFLADFLAHTVLVGFLTGVGFQVGIAMLGDMLGVAANSHNTLVQAWEVLRGLSQANVAVVALSAVVAAGILLGNRDLPANCRYRCSRWWRRSRRAPSFIFAEYGIPEIGPVAGGLPAIGLPDVTWSEVLALLPVAASCFAMIVAQSAATSRAFALRYHEDVDEDADILGSVGRQCGRRQSAARSSSMAARHRPRWRIAPARAARSHNWHLPALCWWCCCS